MRASWIVLVLAACQAGRAPDRLWGGGATAECATDNDCALAGATCCACPTYAVPANDPAALACGAVACPENSCIAEVRAACSGGSCMLACVATACDLSCPDGFALDASGCLGCACAAPPPAPSCTSDTECVRVRADCCGCAGGGTDTAVPTGLAAGHDASLMCPPDPSCPGTDTCSPELAPHCLQGACALVGRLPAGACDRPDLPACPAGETCRINASADATAQGVGVCM